MLQDLRDRVQAADDGEGGFTLIELLVVITILGILAAVVVFSVAGLGDRGQSAACKTDTVTIRTAEEANYAKYGTYAPVTGGGGTAMSPSGSLVSNGFLSSTSTLHSVTTSPAPKADGSYNGPYTGYAVTVTGTTCGASGGVVDGTNSNT